MSDTGTPEPGTPAPPPAPAADAARTFTQEELDRIAGNARTEGRSAAEREVLKALGVENVDAAKAVIAEAKARADAEKSEVERATEALAEAQAQAAAAEARAQKLFAESRLETALRDAGINPKRLQAALRLVDPSALTVTDSEVAGVSEAVEHLKSESPEWFGARAGAPDASGGGGNSTVDFRQDPVAAQKELARLGLRF